MSDWKSRAKPSGSWKERAKPVSKDERMMRAQADETEVDPTRASLSEQRGELWKQMQPGNTIADAARGVMAGATADFDDEFLSAVDATDPYDYSTKETPLADPLDAEPRTETAPLMAGLVGDSEDKDGPGVVERYRSAKQYFDPQKDAARAASPTAYALGQLGGAVFSPLGRIGGIVKGGNLLATAGKTALMGGAYGGLAGLGASRADLTRGEVGQALKDAALPAALGAATAGTSTLVAEPLRRAFASLAAKAQAKALEQAKKLALSNVRAASGALGSETQSASRALENVQRGLENAELSPDARAKLLAAMATPETKALAEQVAVRSADKLGSQAARIAAAEEALRPALAKATPEALKAAQAETLAKPAMRSGLWEIAKRVAPGAGGYAIDRALGGDGSIGGGLGLVAGAVSGQPGRILRNRAATPAFQNALGQAGASVAAGAPRALAAGAAVPQAGDALEPYLRLLRGEDEP